MNIDELHLTTLIFGWLSVLGLVGLIGEQLDKYYAKKNQFDFIARLNNGEILHKDNIFN